MEQSFSQRMGIKSVKSIIQMNSMDEELRNSLWNVFLTQIWNHISPYSTSVETFYNNVWMFHFKRPLDTIPKFDHGAQSIREYFFSCEWNEVYDFIQFVADTHDGEYTRLSFIQSCNSILERELSGYRFIDGLLVPITSQQEIAEIEEALAVSKHFTPHLEQALTLLANRKSPDYRNSIKESILAIEAISQLIAGNHKATLGDALHLVQSKLGSLHPALRNAFNSLYGYTNDAQGIRHALLGQSDLDVEDATFMLIACSAFINYLGAKADKAGLKLTQA